MIALERDQNAHERVLHRVRQRQLQAENCNQRQLAAAYAVAWNFIYAHVFGDVGAPIVAPAVFRPIDTAPPKQRPRWFIEKYSRPLVRVIDRTENFLRVKGSATPQRSVREVLACGHAREFIPFFAEDTTAKHRRCAQCPPKAVASGNVVRMEVKQA